MMMGDGGNGGAVLTASSSRQFNVEVSVDEVGQMLVSILSSAAAQVTQFEPFLRELEARPGFAYALLVRENLLLLEGYFHISLMLMRMRMRMRMKMKMRRRSDQTPRELLLTLSKSAFQLFYLFESMKIFMLCMF